MESTVASVAVPVLVEKTDENSVMAADISAWLGIDRDGAIERGDKNRRFTSGNFEFAVFEGRNLGDYRCCECGWTLRDGWN